jgi:hypothetical protein
MFNDCLISKILLSNHLTCTVRPVNDIFEIKRSLNMFLMICRCYCDCNENFMLLIIHIYATLNEVLMRFSLTSNM